MASLAIGTAAEARAPGSKKFPESMYATEGELPVWPGASGVELRPATMDEDGALHVPAYTLPPSDLVSPQFIEAYKRVVKSIAVFPRPPKSDAPIEEWERFREYEDQRAAARLAEARALNPVEIEEGRIGGVEVAIVTPRGGVSEENRNRVLLYFHGGGFFMNRNLRTGMVSAIPIAAIGRIKVISVSYRQFPEFQYPAASEDVASVFTALLKDYRPDAIGFFGCSGGGVLTGQAVAWLHSKNLPRPGAVGIFCAAPMIPGKGPYLWAASDSRYWGQNANYLGEWPGAAAANGYFKNVKRDDPGAYPGTSEEVLSKFPPTLLISGTRAVEMSQVVAYHAKFLRLGVKSSLYIMENGWHGAMLRAQGTPEGDAALSYITRWFQENLAR